MLHMLLLIFGVFCCSTAVIFVKRCTVDPVSLSALRLLIAALVLLPVFLWHFRRQSRLTLGACIRRTLIPGALLSAHFISWILASRMTPAANASLIVNLVPIVLPLILFVLLRERLTRGEQYGTVLALAGMLLLTAADFQTSREYFLGDMLCLGSMLFFALYLAWARRHQGPDSLWLYVVPLYGVAGMLSLVAVPLAVLMGSIPTPLRAYPPRDLLMVLGLGIVPTVLGHSILNISMRRMRGQVVSIVNMGQFLFAGIMAYFLLDETPQWVFLPASLLVVLGSVAAVAIKRRT